MIRRNTEAHLVPGLDFELVGGALLKRTLCCELFLSDTLLQVDPYTSSLVVADLVVKDRFATIVSSVTPRKTYLSQGDLR